MARNTKASTKFYPGDHLVISDISGQKFLRSECRFDWKGLLMHHSEWSVKHPQIDLRGRRDDIAVKDPRPRQAVRFAPGQGPADSKDALVAAGQPLLAPEEGNKSHDHLEGIGRNRP